LFFALLFSGAAAASAQSTVTINTDSEVAKISLESPAQSWSARGFLPVAVKIENLAEREGVWEIRFEAVDGFGGGVARGVTPARFRVPARSASEAVVFVPGPMKSWGGISHTVILVAGPGVLNGRTALAHHTSSGPAIAVTPAQELAVRAVMSRDDGGGSTLGNNISLNICAPARWPADWRVWAPFEFVAMGEDEFGALDGARRAALREWVALGGTLWLLGRTGQTRSDSPGLGEISLGSAERLVSACRAIKKAREETGGAHYGGRHRRAAASPPDDGDSTRWLEGPWSRLATLLSGDDFKEWEVERGTLPLVLFLIAFGIVVGPVNIFLFAPERRRHRLFFTVPAISVLASALLGVVIVLADGFGGAGARRALVVLMPGENKAAVFQQQVSRTGVLAGKSFAIEDDTAMSREFRPGDDSGIRVSREAGRAEGAWFESRKRQVHSLWRITPTRARVEFAAGKTGEPPAVLSSLTTALRSFTYIDAEGGAWGVEELAPGRRTPLKKLSQGAVAARFAQRINAAGARHGHFYAWGGPGGAPGLAPLDTLKSIRWLDDTVLYTGRVEEARKP
jgi:hypothetical protein